MLANEPSWLGLVLHEARQRTRSETQRRMRSQQSTYVKEEAADVELVGHVGARRIEAVIHRIIDQILRKRLAISDHA